MSKNLLVIGTGGAGNKFLNTFLEIDGSYDGLFVNSNQNEMRNLSKCTLSNMLKVDGDGTGRNRKIAVESIRNSGEKIFNFLFDKTNLYDYYLILASMDGGFGSGSIPQIASAIKKIKPKSQIALALASPKSSAKKLGKENTLDCYNDILQLKKDGVVTSIIFIDNDKMKDEEVFNQRVMNSLILSLNMAYDSIDETDTMLTNFANGYKVVLPLGKKSDSLESAIEKATDSSLFLLPKSFRCSHMLGTFQRDVYDKDDATDLFRVKDFDKVDYNEEFNMIVLGGCKIPTEFFAKIEDDLEKIDSEEDEDEDEFMVKRIFKSKSSSDKVIQDEEEDAPILSKKELRAKLGKSLWD